jgi:PTS system mannose-specific IIC component
MTEILLIALFAAVAHLDVTAIGPVMLSRPLVCASVLGWFLGDIKIGVWIGIIVELLWTSIIPMGASILLDTSVLSIFTISVGKISGCGDNAIYIIALAIAIPVAVVFRKLEIAQRYFNIKIVHWAEQGILHGDEKRISHGIYAGLALYFLKGFVFYAVLLYPAAFLVKYIFSCLSKTAVAGLNISLIVLPVVGLGIFLSSFHNKFLGSR